MTGMLYMKYFVFYNLLGEVVSVFLNFVLFDEGKYKDLFLVLLLLSVVAVFLHLKFLYRIV